MNILAIDIGGTTIKSDVYCNEKSLHLFNEIQTEVDLNKGTNGILNQVQCLIAQMIQQLKTSNQTLDGVAIATAGVVDTNEGKVAYAGYTIPNYANTDFKSMIGSQFNLPSIVLNDVNSATYAEYKLNNYQKEQTLVCLTIGTGIGSGMVVNGDLLIGQTFSAGEIGYTPINGHKYQDIASTNALIQAYKEASKTEQSVNGKMIFKAYHDGDKVARQTIEHWVEHIVDGILPIVYVLNPSIIAFGGGVMAQHNVLLPKIKEVLKNKLETNFFMPTIIKPMSVGNEAGRIGAYYYFINQYNEKI